MSHIHHNMPGPGDVITWGACTGHPMDPRNQAIDDMEPTREEMLEMEADAILAECETVGGATEFVSAWVGDNQSSLVGFVFSVATAPAGFAQVAINRWHGVMRREAMRQAAERYPEVKEMPC
jgi:hypothetical protein